MKNSNSCSNRFNAKKKRVSFNTNRLEFLKFIRDTLERRIAAVNASIDTLKSQIERDSEEEVTDLE